MTREKNPSEKGSSKQSAQPSKADKKEGKKEKEGGIAWSHVALVAIFVVAFVATVLFIAGRLPFFKEYRVQEREIYGITVFSAGEPEQELTQVLSGDRIVMKIVTYKNADFSDKRNGLLSLVVVELGYEIATHRPFAAYGQVLETGEYVEGSCTEETNFCSDPQVVVAVSDCNCLRIEDGKAFVLFDEEHLLDADVRYRLRGMFGGVLKGG